MDTIEFLENHFRYCDGGVLELRAIEIGQGSRDRMFTPLGALGGVKAFCSKNVGFDIYFGVGARDGAGGTAEHVAQIPCCWVDIDFKHIDKRLAWDNLKNFPFKPSVVVKSGGGIHCYFYLSEPAEKDDFERVLRPGPVAPTRPKRKGNHEVLHPKEPTWTDGPGHPPVYQPLYGDRRGDDLKTSFKPNRHFRREYDRLFKKDPRGANLFLLLCERADKNGQVLIDEKVLTKLMGERFDDPREYAL